MRRLLLTAVALLALAGRADALTVRDIIELSRAGLGEEVLLALIDVNRGVYGIDTATLKSLKDAGVPEKVIVALVRSGREAAPEPLPAPPAVDPPAPPEPQVVVIEHHAEPPVREVMVPVPVYIPVDGSRGRYRRSVNRGPVDSTYVPFQSGPPLHQPPPQKKAEPVYWGFGGKLRPDAWKPDGHVEHGEREKARSPGPADRERR